MDINSLLSPQKSPREPPPPAAKSSAKKPRKPRSSKSSNTTHSAPPTDSSIHSTAFSHNAVVQTAHTVPSPPRISPTSTLQASSIPAADSIRPVRQPSTPGMDALADLASMQHPQQNTRTNAGGLRNAEIHENQVSSAAAMTNMPPKSTSRDFSKADVPSQASSPQRFSASSLSEEELRAVAQLVRDLGTNPFAYESHVQLVKLLHKGLVSHMRANSSLTIQGDPRRYELLQDLQSAREAMNATFALGEDLWVDWIQDQKLLATTLEDKITVIESCRKSVEEESGSMRLWLLYTDWMLSLYKIGNPDDPRIKVVGVNNSQGQDWSEEDKLMAREVYSWEQMLEVWRQGVQDTKWRINDSHLLWDPYTQFLSEDTTNTSTEQGIRSIKFHFLDRLQTPHATWDETFQSFSNFVSKFYNASYEDTMVAANKQGSVAKSWYGLREGFELSLQRARENNDIEAEWGGFDEYITWEKVQIRKKNASSFELIDALYQRATLRLPTDTQFWECYVMFLNDELLTRRRHDVPVLTVLERATRHCPWSGTLWSQHILAAERSSRPFPDIHHIKHKATSTGLLDAGDMTDILRVHTAWCGYLRRWAFYHESTDEEMDVAEVGIRSAIEDMGRIGRAKYGEDYKGDAAYRLESIYIRYLSQCQNWKGAREYWKSLSLEHGDSYDFWLRYYLWEMSISDKLGYAESDLNGSESTQPMESTKVLRTAIKRPSLDWPEKIMEVYQYHCEDHETLETLQSAVVQIWKTKRIVKRRREKEKEAYELAQLEELQQQQQPTQPDTLASDNTLDNGKRKREDEVELEQEPTPKKIRPDDEGAKPMLAAQPLSAPSVLKRDRENSTVIVRNLPPEITEIRVRQYFRDCGTINSLKLLREVDKESATATIEFDSNEDVLTAQTKDMKFFDSRTIEVQVGTGSTLFVTNFLPTADEQWIRQEFGKFGEIIDIRFPSLKGNTHRRFCYVQFKSSTEAEAATTLDGESVGDNLKLSVRISDPGKRQERVGPLHEGRELHLSNVDWNATEDDISQAFSKYGKVERVRLPRAVGGKSKGFAFVVFSTKEEAVAALDMNFKHIKSRQLYVSISTNDLTKRQANTAKKTMPHSSTSPSPGPLSTTGEIDNAAFLISSIKNEARPSKTDIQARTVALLNVPDTVNDARIRALAEPYGVIVKVVLRPDHQGAIIEYGDIASAGKAALGIDGHEIAPGRKLGVGSVREMLLQKEERKTDKIGANGLKKDGGAKVSLLPSAPIRRPTQPIPRRSGKVSLGAKRGGLGWSAPTGQADQLGKESKTNGSAADAKPKSNDDFRAMVLKK